MSTREAAVFWLVIGLSSSIGLLWVLWSARMSSVTPWSDNHLIGHAFGLLLFGLVATYFMKRLKGFPSRSFEWERLEPLALPRAVKVVILEIVALPLWQVDDIARGLEVWLINGSPLFIFWDYEISFTEVAFLVALTLATPLWTCRVYIPVSELIYAAFCSNAKGLLRPSDE